MERVTIYDAPLVPWDDVALFLFTVIVGLITIEAVLTGVTYVWHRCRKGAKSRDESAGSGD